MDTVITFWYGDPKKAYIVPLEARRLNRIVLPDKRVLEAEGWLDQEDPPYPYNFRVVPHALFWSTPERIAQVMDGVVATLVEKPPVI